MSTALERINVKCEEASRVIEEAPETHWTVKRCKKCGRRYYVKGSTDGICRYHGYGVSHLPEYIDDGPVPVEISSENRLALGDGSYQCRH